MKLPVIEHPLHEIMIPSEGRKAEFRPYLVKEEKILLMAQSSGEDRDIIRALIQIIQNTCQEDIKIGEKPEFDLEYIFTKLRAVSVSNIATFNMATEEGDPEVMTVNLDQVELTKPEAVSPIAWIDEKKGFGIKLKFPSCLSVLETKNPDLDEEAQLNAYLIACIDEIFNAEDIYNLKESTSEDQIKFIDSLPVSVLEHIKTFADSAPYLEHTFKHKDQTITLRGLNDFFTWG